LNESIQKHEKSLEAFRQNFIDGVLASVPGGGRLVAQKDLAVQEQLAGNRYVGTGISLSFDVDKKYPRIETVFPGGPMERAGGHSGDWMLKIDDRDAHGLELAKIIELLRGDEGTDVALLLGDATGASRTITVTRGPVVLETIEGFQKSDARGHWDFRIDANSPIRYLKIVQVNGSTVHDLKKLETEFRRSGATAVILDLRAVHGGELHHAMLLADALLDGGQIGRVRTQGDVQEFRADRERVFRDWPVVLLVDSQTGGVAEWIAAAVQDNRAGKVVGEDTAGIWQVSSAIQLSGMNSSLLLRTGTFERPNRNSAHRKLVRNPRIIGEAPVAEIANVVTPDRRIAGDVAPTTGPFAVLRKPVPPAPAPPGRQEDDAILKLAVEELKRTVSLNVLKDRVNAQPTDGN
jgi:carboxyl-terminal processing protease